MKTLAELKRNANAGRMALELLEWYGESGEGIPERLRGIRKVKRANSVALILENASGAESEMRIEAATLVEYDGEYLTIYQAGKRPLNQAEYQIMLQVRKLYEEYKDTYSGGFWQVRGFLQDSECPWMAGDDFRYGKKYDRSRNVVLDKAIKGEAILKYKVYWI